MCTVSVKVNEALLRGMRPELNSTAAIRQWAQQQIDLRIQQMELDDQETMTIEDAREMTLAAVREEYVPNAETRAAIEECESGKELETLDIANFKAYVKSL